MQTVVTHPTALQYARQIAMCIPSITCWRFLLRERGTISRWRKQDVQGKSVHRGVGKGDFCLYLHDEHNTLAYIRLIGTEPRKG